MTKTCLLYGADSHTRSTGHNKVAVFDIWPNLIKNKGDDVGLHGQKEDITSADRLLVAGGKVHTQFL